MSDNVETIKVTKRLMCYDAITGEIFDNDECFDYSVGSKIKHEGEKYLIISIDSVSYDSYYGLVMNLRVIKNN